MSQRFSSFLAIVRMALTQEAKGGAPIDSANIWKLVRAYQPIAWADATEDDLHRIVAEIEKLYNVWSGPAGTLRGKETGHQEWLSLRSDRSDWRFWARYREYLEQRLPPRVVEELHEVTDEILGMLGDPRRTDYWRRQGLVVGHVQSGKTANYTGLICKAADAGYKVIVVLAGIHNSLRAQTQIRLDDGFLGYARPFDKSHDYGTLAGVGLIAANAVADTATTRDERGDFNKQSAKAFQIHAGGNPLLFVVKKNTTVLKNLISWVKLNATALAGADRKVVDTASLLVIDDEADQASIDTKFQTFTAEGEPDPDHDPTKINKHIRSLLHSFARASYVGYTATPFANVFVHPRGALDEFGPDLFPRDFIMNLAAPSDYFGPISVFGGSGDKWPEQGSATSRVRFITDTAEWVPASHKNTHLARYKGAARVPPSLEEAIRAFLLTSAARRARGQDHAHSSMLIHVTRFTSVQEQVFRQVKSLVDDLSLRWRGRETTAGETLSSELQLMWEQDFLPTSSAHGGVLTEWSAVESQIWPVLHGLRLMLINAKAKEALLYEEYANSGLTVIAVGGDKLSRGLTLEGLSVSYFLRSARMYDTLMQMGRWFGYRPGYEDLCRLYLSGELAEWYTDITEASEELRAEFERMVTVNETPSTYGLRVRKHPVLAITGKLRPGTRTIRTSFSATPFEPTVIREAAIQPNWNNTASFLTRLGAPNAVSFTPDDEGLARTRKNWPGAMVWREIDGLLVLEHLAQHEFPEASLTRNPPAVVLQYIRDQQAQGELVTWTVVLLGKAKQTGGDDPSITYSLPAVSESMATLFRKRNREATGDGNYVVKRVGSPGDESIDLSRKEWEHVLQQQLRLPDPEGKRSEWTEGRLIRDARPKERGLLIIYALTPPGAAGSGNESEVPMVVPVISFPNSPGAKGVEYTLNQVYYENEIVGAE